MNVSRTLAMSQEFHNLAQQTIVDAFENAARMVHVHIIYQRPDSPALVQEFTWGAEDMLIPAVKLAEMVKSTRQAFDRAGGAWGVEQAIREMEDVMDAVKLDIEKAKELPREFSMTFKDRTPVQQAIMIEHVPFQRMQRLLTHWHSNLTTKSTNGGALNHVTFTQDPLTDHQPLRTMRAGKPSFN